MSVENSRRSFLKKATYGTPAVIALGALAPTMVNAKANSAILGLRSKIRVDRQDIKTIRAQIIDLQNQRDALRGKANKQAREDITNQIHLLRAQINGERAEIRDFRNQIRVIRHG